MATLSLNIKGPAGSKGPTGDPGPAGSTGAQGLTAVSADSGNQAKLGTDAKIWTPNLTPPLATSAQNGLLTQVSGNTTDFVDGTNHTQGLAAAIQPTIWSVRQRNYNALGNPNFEVTNKWAGVQTGSSAWAGDRWIFYANGAPVNAHATRIWAANPPVILNNRCLSNSLIQVLISTVQATLGASDYHEIVQYVEGPMARELMIGPTSISLVAQCSVAPFSFCLSLRDSQDKYSYCHLCTIPTANTWTLIQIPNIPQFTFSGTFPATPGSSCYQLSITVAAGSSFIPSSNDAWVSGNFIGAIGMNNFFAFPVNTYFQVGFVQHEPGATCNNLIDIPFDKNQQSCLRYYQKSLSYGVTVPGGINASNYKMLGVAIATTSVRLYVDYQVPMAKTPSVVLYGYNSASPNYIYFDPLGNVALSAAVANDERSMWHAPISSAAFTAPQVALGEWTADTGW